MKYAMKLVLVAVLSLSILAGCKPPAVVDNKTIKISDSSALRPLVTAVAEKFNITNPDVKFKVNEGVSGNGPKDVFAGTVDIGNSDVPAAEVILAADAATLIDNKVCVVGVAVVLSTDLNSYLNWSKEEIIKIFTGKVKNWKELDGPDLPIVVINRPTTSETRALFTKWGLDGGKMIDGDTALQTDDSNAIIKTMATAKGAISYVPFPYIKDNADVVAAAAIDGVEPTNEFIYDGTYQIWGYEHMYTKGEPTNPTVKSFLTFMESTGAETQMEEMNYGIISKLSKKVAASR